MIRPYCLRVERLGPGAPIRRAGGLDPLGHRSDTGWRPPALTDDRIEVVVGSADAAGPGKPYGNQPIFELPGTYVGLTRLAPGAVTPWHHHVAYQFFGWVVQGTVSLEYGPGGRHRERVSAGQFFRIPPHLVHRDVNDTPETVLVATWCVGEGPASVVVDGPAG